MSGLLHYTWYADGCWQYGTLAVDEWAVTSTTMLTRVFSDKNSDKMTQAIKIAREDMSDFAWRRRGDGV